MTPPSCPWGQTDDLVFRSLQKHNIWHIKSRLFPTDSGEMRILTDVVPLQHFHEDGNQ